MRTRGKSIRSGDRNIDKRITALGVVGFLALAAAFFFLGLFCLGPLVRSHLLPSREVTQSPSHVTSAEPGVRTPSDTEAREEPSVDIEITERTEDEPAGDETGLSDEGLRQDEDSLTVTLEQEGRERPSAARPGRRPAREDGGPRRPGTATDSTREPTSTSSGSRIFRVRVGTFSDRANAENLAADLRRQGFAAEASPVLVEGQTLYRVQVGEYKTRDDAQEVADKLIKSGHAPIITTERKEE